MRQGFTLVELSIVLVILGLLVGGVLAGQSLIHASELRTVSNEYGRFQTALNSFRDKYFALPGDMPNAVRFWGAQAGGTADGYDATCAASVTAATGTETCNGNGDGMMPSMMTAYGPIDNEYFRSWQHLTNAGLIEGRVTGVRGPASPIDSVVGTNVPKSKFGSAGWTFVSNGPGIFILSSWYPFNYGNFFYFGASYSGLINYTTVLRADDAYNIDVKSDDGKPNTGLILSHTYAARPNCVNSTDDAYLLTDQTIGCNLIFRLSK